MNELVVVSSTAHLRNQPGPARHKQLCTVDDFFRRVSVLAFLEGDRLLGADDLRAIAAEAVTAHNPAHLPSLNNYLAVLKDIYHGGRTFDEVAPFIAELTGGGDLGDMLAAITQQLEKVGRLFSWQALHFAWRHLQRVDKLPISLPDSIIFLDVIELSPLQINILKRLVELGVSIKFHLSSSITALSAELLELFHLSGIRLEIIEAVTLPFSALVTNFFADEAKAPSQHLHVCAAPSPRAEAKFIASSICQLKSIYGPQSTVALTFGRYNKKIELICDVLADFGLRAQNKTTLTQAPCTQLLSMIIDARLKQWPVEQLLNIVTHANYKNALPSPKDYALLWQTMRLANIKSDREGESCLDGVYERRLTNLQANDPSQAAAVDHARKIILELFAAGNCLSLSNTMPGFMAAILTVIDEYSVEEVDDGRLKLRDYIQSCLDSLTASSLHPSISLLAFKRWFIDSCNKISWSVISSDQIDVELVPLNRIWARKFDIVILCDLAHGVVPNFTENKALNHSAQKEINARLGQSLFQSTDGSGSSMARLELIRFSGACLAAQKELILSTALRDEAHKEQATSVFFRRVLQAVGIAPDTFTGIFSALPQTVSASEFSFFQLREQINQYQMAPDNCTLSDDIKLTLQSASQRKEFFRSQGDDNRRYAPFSFSLGSQAQSVFSRKLGFFEQHPLTATKLESFAICRYRAFLQNVLGVLVQEDLGHDAAPRLLGQLAHKVLQKYYQTNRRRNIVLSNFNQEQREFLTGLFWQEAKHFMSEWVGNHELALQARLTWLHGSLQKLIYFLSSHPPIDEVEPQEFELAIGTSLSSYQAVPILLGEHTIYFGGIIDRVDEGPDTRVVIDYKMSSKAAIQSRMRDQKFLTTHFQLPLYLRLLEHIRPSYKKNLTGYLVSIKDAVTSAIIGRDKFSDLREIITDDLREDGLAQSAYRVLQPLFAGFAPADVGEACTSCTFSRVCRMRVNHGN